jgi:ferrous iron transport protein B
MVVLWFLASFPAPPAGSDVNPLAYSFAGRLGSALEPVFAPLGFNWQICIAGAGGARSRGRVAGDRLRAVGGERIRG